MSYFYSASNRAFYNTDVVSTDAMPADKVAVTDADYSALMQAQSDGKLIRTSASGAPEAVNQNLSPCVRTMQDIVRDLQDSWSVRVASTAYAMGDIVDCPYKRGYQLLCTRAGTSGADDLVQSNLVLGQTFTDGTVQWKVHSKGTEQVANADLNTLLGDKAYSCSGTLKNTPVTCTFCIVQAYDTGAEVSGSIVQICYIPQTDNTVRSYVRNCVNGTTFGKWTSIGAVQTVNGILPDSNGNIVIPNATATTFGIMRTASAEDELNCTCDEAAITPQNFYDLADYRRASTAYAVGDKVAFKYDNTLYMECTEAGTTSADALNTRGYKHGRTVVDGSVEWLVKTRVLSVNGNQPDENGNVEASGVPVGTVEYFAMTTPPAGYLKADGAAVGRETYPDLFAAIGTTFGVGDGSTTFKLPDLINRFAQGSNTPGQKIEAGLPNITGSISNLASGGTSLSDATGMASIDQRAVNDKPAAGVNGNTVQIGLRASRSNPIYGASSTVQPPALTLLPCIKAFDAATNPGLIDITGLANEMPGKADNNLSNLTVAGKSVVATLAMPSDRYIDLTLGISGAAYTAPATGWVSMWRVCNGQGGLAGLYGRTVSIFSGDQNEEFSIFIPVSKGEVFHIYHSELKTGQPNDRFRFVYAGEAQ